MLFSAAFAQDTASTAAQAPGFDPMGLMLPLLLLAIFYFLLIRPQQKRYKEHQAMVASVRRGDKVVTGGGIIGTVSKVDEDDVLQVEIAPNVVVKVTRDTISNVLNRTGATEPEEKK